jgi:aerobic carbon-monoxide dehydrogenase large subunit
MGALGMTDTVASRYAGARVPRVEDARLLTGHGTFVDDIVRPGMLHACFVRSPFARARINSIDASAALEMPGVRAVFTAADLNPDVKEAWHAVVGKDMPDTPRPPLAEGEAKFVGDPVALVVAVNRYVAEDAAELVDVDYEPLAALADFTKASDSSVVVHDAYPENVALQLGFAPPDEETFAAAAHVVAETIYQQIYVPVPMETRGIVVEWLAATEEVTVWASTQIPHELRAFCARLLGLPAQRVRVIVRDTGGGFGQKVVPMREDMCIMLAARKVTATSNAPSDAVALKWIEDRRENLMSGGQARHVIADARMAFDEDGNILAADIDYRQDVGAYPTPYPVSQTAIGMLFPGPYRVPKASFKYQAVFSNTTGLTAYRGPWQFETLAREILLDIAARELGMEPAELRRRNILRGDEMPYLNANGMPYDNVVPADTFEQAVKILDHEGFRAMQADALAQGRYIGLGFSAYIEPTAAATGNLSIEGATIRMEPTGKINVYVNGGSAGNSIETTVVQLTADALGADIADVATIQGDTAVTPYGGGTQGSRSGPMTAGAVNEAGTILRKQIIALAAHRLGVEESDIELADSCATARTDPSKSVTFADLAYQAHYQPSQVPPGMSASLEATARYTMQAPFHWANATHACTCEVDVQTGAVTITRYIVSEDVGPMINPNVVEGQIAGGTVQGIGGALLENLAYDDDGNPLASTFVDYLLPTATDVPTIEYGHIEIPGPGVGGYKGVGEGGAIGSTAAVINAINDALAPLGVKLTRLPASPAAIVALIEESQ